MPCPSCYSKECVHVDNHVTCTSCGLMYEHKPQYVQSYTDINSPYRRKTYYNRIKRFAKKLKESQYTEIHRATEKLLRLYGILEFGWGIFHNGTRKYFFSQKVVLYCLARLSNLDLDLPLLKNANRSDVQLRAIAGIFESCIDHGFLNPLVSDRRTYGST